MKIIVYLLGFGHIAACTALILYTRETVDWLNGLFRTYPLKYLAAIPAAVGLLFLIASPATAYPWVFRLIGLLAIAEGIVAFTNPRKIYSRMLDWYVERVRDQTQRLFGIVGVIFGTVILTWAM